MKTPISYYGGKQKLSKLILSLIPAHHVYVEPFFGGGAVFFAKNQSPVEVINDLDDRVINFYRIVKTRFDELQNLIIGTLHSETEHKRAGMILRQESPDPVELAWAFWVQTNLSFGKKLHGGFGFDNIGRSSRATDFKRKGFTKAYCERLERVEVFCRDACQLIIQKDQKSAFFYVDPPYVSSDQGHYKGYTEANFKELLSVLAGIKGKFLLSSYLEPSLQDHRNQYGWNFKDLNLNFSMASGKKIKTECLTFNYNLKENQGSLFHEGQP
jgi:DNA adenine methylase